MEQSKLLIQRYPQLEIIEREILNAYEVLAAAYKAGNKLLVAGNGGSAADADHIVGELMKGFKSKRVIDWKIKKELQSIDPILGKELGEKLQGTLCAINLANHISLNTAFSNDVDGSMCFAQQVWGYGDDGDVFLGITTSGGAENIVKAAVVAKAKRMKVIALTGNKLGNLAKVADVVINVPEQETFKVQELHLPIYHCLCLMLEEEFFK